MFQFPGFALNPLFYSRVSTWFTQPLISLRLTMTKCQVGCPIRRFLDQSLFSAPQDLSQSITSFIASYCQGIHQTPFSRLIRSRKSKTWGLLYSFKLTPLVCQPHGLASFCQKSYFSTPPMAGSLIGVFWLVYLTWTKLL